MSKATSPEILISRREKVQEYADGIEYWAARLKEQMDEHVDFDHPYHKEWLGHIREFTRMIEDIFNDTEQEKFLAGE